MADNMTGVYNEVLKVTFDTGEWAKSLNIARDEWKKFKGELGKDANNAIGTSAMSSMVEGINALAKAFKDLQHEQHLAHSETMDLLKKETAATIDAEKKAADAIDKKISKREKYLQSLKRTAEFTDRNAQPFGLDKTARDIRTEEEGVLNRTAEERRKYVLWWEQIIRRMELMEEGKSQRAAEKRQRYEQQVEQWWLKALKNREQAELDAIERVRRKQISYIQDNTTVKQLVTPNAAAKADDLAMRVRKNYAQEMLGQYTAISAELEHQEKAQKKVTAEASKHKSVMDRLLNEDGWKSTLAHLLKFYVLWNTLNGAIQLTATLLKAPFQMIGMGLQYLQETERAADDLVGVIATNAKFSKNYADNFRIAKEQAIEVTKALQEQAILTGFTATQLEGTFKALMESGATRFVSTLGQMVELATMFQMALKAAGAGGLAAQTSVQEMGRLFRGIPAADNKFLAYLRLSVGEWTTLRDRVKETRDLVPILADRTKEFRDALLEAGKGQRVLLDTLQLQIQRVMGDATAGLFETLNKSLLELSTWIQEHKGDIIALFSGLSTAIQGVVEAIRQLGSNPQAFDGLLAGAGMLVATLQEGVLWIETMLRDLDDIATHGFWAGNAKAFMRHRKEASDRQESQARADVEEIRRQDLNASKTTIMSRLSDKGYSSSEARQAVGLSLWDELNPDNTLRNSKMPVGIYGPLQSKSQDLNASFMDRVRASREEMKASLEAMAKESAERLKRVFEPGDGNNGRTDSMISNYVRKYELFRSEVELKIREIDEKYAEKRSDLREQLDGDAISKKTFAANMKAVVEEENQAILEQQQKLMEEVAATRTKILGEGNIDTKKSRDEAIRFSKLYVDLDRETVQRRKKANKEVSDADRVAIKEQSSIAIAGYKFRQDLLKQEQDANLKAIEERKNSGYLTAYQAFEEENKVKQQSYQEQLGNLFDSLMYLPEESEKWVKVFDEIVLLDKEHAVELKQQQLIGQRLLRDEEARLELHLKTLRAQVIQQQETSVDRDRLLNPIDKQLESERSLLELKHKELVVQLAIAKVQYEAAVARNADTEQTRQLLELLGEINNQLDTTENSLLAGNLSGMSGGLLAIRRRQSGGGEDGNSLMEGIFGTKFAETLKGASFGLGKFGVGLVGATNALTTFQGVLTAIKQGYSEGGVLGGIGAGASQAGGTLGSFKGALGAASPYLQAVGSVFSVIGGLMKAAAKKLAESLKKSFDNLMTDYERGNKTLVQTISELERLRSQAISSLSGKKGGKEELDKLLPQFESQLYSLKEQQEQILESFTDSLDALRLSSDTLADIHKKWDDINKQVQEYLGAGGDAANAAEYLSLQLGKIRADAVAELDSAEQDAIETMLKLNDLLKQRVDLVDEFKQKEFDLINADSIERRGGGSVARGKELANLRKQHEEQLAELDEEIRRTQLRVDKEQEIFNLQNDVAALKRRDEELTLKALDAQIQKMRDLQSIVSSITQGQNGWIGSGILGPQSTTVNIDVSITSPVDDPTAFGKSLGENLASEFLRQVRVAPV